MSLFGLQIPKWGTPTHKFSFESNTSDDASLGQTPFDSHLGDVSPFDDGGTDGLVISDDGQFLPPALLDARGGHQGHTGGEGKRAARP